MEDDTPIFGLIHIPPKEETFYGYNNGRGVINGHRTPIHTRSSLSKDMTFLLGGHGKSLKMKKNFY